MSNDDIKRLSLSDPSLDKNADNTINVDKNNTRKVYATVRKLFLFDLNPHLKTPRNNPE